MNCVRFCPVLKTGGPGTVVCKISVKCPSAQLFRVFSIEIAELFCFLICSSRTNHEMDMKSSDHTNAVDVFDTT